MKARVHQIEYAIDKADGRVRSKFWDNRVMVSNSHVE